jgi:hypothetical protein
MPYVEVKHKPGLEERLLLSIKSILKASVSRELDCSDEDPDAGLTEEDINVSFRPYGPLDDQPLDIDAWIIAKWYGPREKRVDTATADIRDALCRELGYSVDSIGVFVTLPVAGWAMGYPGD